jgi:type VII secretion integral membrane protein EccD
VTGIRELGRAPTVSPAPEHVRVSVLGGRTQLDVALPLDASVATLVPELVRLVRSRDTEASSDTTTSAQHTFWVLRRLDPITPLQPDETLRAADVGDGELLHLSEQRAPCAPTLYDDVVDAAARLNEAAHAGWNASAARWMSFLGAGVASLAWVCIVVAGSQRAATVGLATMVVAGMVGAATLAHRRYGQADVGAVVAGASIPISAAIAWALAAPFGGYALAAGCALLVVLNASWCWVVGAGGWGFLSSGVFFGAGGLAVLGHALGVSAQTVGIVLAVTAVLACRTVPRLTGRLARVEPSAAKPDADDDAAVLQTPSTREPSSSAAGCEDSAAAARMPTAEEVWARVHSAALRGSAFYAGLGASLVCAVATVVRAQPQARWAALVFAGVCAAALGLYARAPGTAVERVSLGVPAVALVVVGCVSAQRGTAAMSWVGFATVFALAAVASVTGLRLAGANPPRPGPTAWAYLQYAAFAALVPVALWPLGVYVQLDIP